MSILRKVLTSTTFAATILCGSGATILTTSSPAAAQARSSYGSVTYLGNTPAYSYPSRSGQMGNVTFFGARPTTFPSHNGQYGNVTFLGGAQPYTFQSHSGQYGNVTFFGGRPYTYPSHSGQYGNVTYIGVRPAGTVPIRVVPTPGIVPVRTIPTPGLVRVR